MKKEIKAITGCPGYYVSNYGEVYSKWTGRGRGSRIGESLRRLNPIKADGRWVVGLRRNGRKVVVRIHRLVLEAFVGPRPSGYQACHFPDANTANNRLDNLRWDTSASNYNDRRHHGTCNSGERNGSSKLTRAHVEKIRALRKDGVTYKELGERFSVSTSNAQSICKGWTWKQY
jgi:hypothetical protein